MQFKEKNVREVMISKDFLVDFFNAHCTISNEI